jgi:phage gp36-like protein
MPSPWITLTEDHIIGSLAAAEVSALRTLQLTPGQSDPLPEAMIQAVGKVHGYVATRYTVGQPGTVPEQLLGSTIAIGRWILISRLPVKLLATEIRKQQYDDGIAELKDVASGKFKLSVTDEPGEDQPGPTGGSAWGGAKQF